MNMYNNKNAFLLVMTLFLALHTTFGQRSKLMRYDIGAGLGVFPTFLKDQGRMVLPPLSLQADYRLAEKVSVGLMLGFSTTESRQNMLPENTEALLRNQFSTVGLRLAAHTARFENWDVYGGFTLAYMHSRIEVLRGDLDKLQKHQGLKPSSGRMVMSGFVGSRLRLDTHLGMFTEVGFGVSLLRLGLSYRF